MSSPAHKRFFAAGCRYASACKRGIVLAYGVLAENPALTDGAIAGIIAPSRKGGVVLHFYVAQTEWPAFIAKGVAVR
jgi:hypothetical protein